LALPVLGSVAAADGPVVLGAKVFGHTFDLLSLDVKYDRRTNTYPMRAVFRLDGQQRSVSGEMSFACLKLTNTLYLELVGTKDGKVVSVGRQCRVPERLGIVALYALDDEGFWMPYTKAIQEI